MAFCSIGTMKTALGIDFMYKLLTAAFCLLAVSVFGASPSFQSFNQNQFNTNGLNIAVKSGALFTNPIINSGTITGNGSGLSNVLARYGIESLASANVVNVTNFGAVPYIPNNFAPGAWPTNAVDNTVALSNAFAFASNVPAPRVIYFPPGFYKYTNTLTIPPLTTVVGEGWLRNGGAAATRVQTAPNTVATNNYSVLWFLGGTNKTALAAPYQKWGRMAIRDIEVCGYTNGMADIGQGWAANTIETADSKDFGWCGIDMTSGTFSGSFTLERVSVTGFKVGINHGGNNCEYIRCSFGGNDIGMICTNVQWAPDNVIIRECSIGTRRGGLGYYFAGVRGFFIDGPADIDFYTFAVFNSSQVTIVGGNQECNAVSTETPQWTFVETAVGSFGMTNTWPYQKKAFIHLNKLSAINNSASTAVTVMGGQMSDGSGIMDALFVDYSAASGASASITCINQNFDSTNIIGGLQTVLICDAFRADSIHYIGHPARKSAIVELWTGGLAVKRYTQVVGERATFADTEYQTSFGTIIYGTIDPAFTNLVLSRYGQLEFQQGTTTYPDYLMMTIGTNYVATVPQLAYARIPFMDPGGLAPDGRPNTNLTVRDIRVRGNLMTDGSGVFSNSLSVGAVSSSLALFEIHTYGDPNFRTNAINIDDQFIIYRHKGTGPLHFNGLQTGATGFIFSTNNVPLVTISGLSGFGVRPRGYFTNGIYASQYDGNGIGITNGSAGLATNSATASDGMVLSKSGTNLLFIANGTGDNDPTNTAPFAITNITFGFAIDTIYTNGNQRAHVQQSYDLDCVTVGPASVSLYLDQNADGTFERQNLEIQSTSASALRMIIGSFLQPNARFMFTNTSGGDGSVGIVVDSSQWTGM